LNFGYYPASQSVWSPKLGSREARVNVAGVAESQEFNKDSPRFFRRELQSPFREAGVRANLFEKIFLVLKIFSGSDNSGLFAIRKNPARANQKSQTKLFFSKKVRAKCIITAPK